MTVDVLYILRWGVGGEGRAWRWVCVCVSKTCPPGTTPLSLLTIPRPAPPPPEVNGTSGPSPRHTTVYVRRPCLPRTVTRDHNRPTEKGSTPEDRCLTGVEGGYM